MPDSDPRVEPEPRIDVHAFTRHTIGLSLHKKNYILPLTWSSDYKSEETELIFQLSAKVQIRKSRFYFGFTQVSFWQAYHHDLSVPFRETNYNPEFFYRFTSGDDPFGVDLGVMIAQWQ